MRRRCRGRGEEMTRKEEREKNDKTDDGGNHAYGAQKEEARPDRPKVSPERRERSGSKCWRKLCVL